MIKLAVKGLNSLLKSFDRAEKQLIEFVRGSLTSFASQVSTQAQKNMRIRSGHLGRPPWYRTRNTGKHLRVASSVIKDSLRRVRDFARSTNNSSAGSSSSSSSDASIWVYKETESRVSIVFGTQASNPDDGFGYAFFHEHGRFPFFYQHATQELLNGIALRNLRKVKF